MKDIPVFTTEDGVSSLLLKEVPYKKTAYIRVQSVQPGRLAEHLAECAGFCRMLDAEHIYAAGHPELERWPLHCSVVSMSLALDVAEPDANLWPVTAETVSEWRRIYNEKMAAVDNAATLTAFDEAEILSSGGAYFVHEKGALLGIGWVRDDRIEAVAALVSGAGERVLGALLSVCCGERASLEVASTNARAIRLYEKMGFIQTGEVSRWYKIR